MTSPAVDHVPHLRQLEAEHLRQQHAKQLGRLSLETGNSLPTTIAPGSLPGDPLLLRGIPVVGVPGGYGGAIRGSRR